MALQWLERSQAEKVTAGESDEQHDSASTDHGCSVASSNTSNSPASRKTQQRMPGVRIFAASLPKRCANAGASVVDDVDASFNAGASVVDDVDASFNAGASVVDDVGASFFNAGANSGRRPLPIVMCDQSAVPCFPPGLALPTALPKDISYDALHPALAAVGSLLQASASGAAPAPAAAPAQSRSNIILSYGPHGSPKKALRRRLAEAAPAPILTYGPHGSPKRAARLSSALDAAPAAVLTYGPHGSPKRAATLSSTLPFAASSSAATVLLYGPHGSPKRRNKENVFPQMPAPPAVLTYGPNGSPRKKPPVLLASEPVKTTLLGRRNSGSPTKKPMLRMSRPEVQPERTTSCDLLQRRRSDGIQIEKAKHEMLPLKVRIMSDQLKKRLPDEPSKKLSACATEFVPGALASNLMNKSVPSIGAKNFLSVFANEFVPGAKISFSSFPNEFVPSSATSVCDSDCGIFPSATFSASAAEFVPGQVTFSASSSDFVPDVALSTLPISEYAAAHNAAKQRDSNHVAVIGTTRAVGTLGTQPAAGMLGTQPAAGILGTQPPAGILGTQPC